MAAYVGTGRIAAPALARRRPAPRTRARRRASPVGVSLAGILTAFLLALFYLTQTIHVAATNHEVGQLLAEQQSLTQQAQSLRGEIYRWGAEPAIVKNAQQAGFGRLGSPLRLRGR